MHDLTALLLEEAQETDHDSYDSAAEYEFYNGKDAADENPYEGRTFHPFSKLPPELRIRVWELALVRELQPRILHFGLDLSPRPFTELDDHGDVIIDWTVQPSRELAKETRNVRRIVAVNREARDVVLKTLPHTLKLGPSRTGRGPATVHLHRDRDVAYLSAGDRFLDTLCASLRGDWQHGGRCRFEGFAENVTQLAIDCCSLSVLERLDINRLYTHILEPFPNLKRLFFDLPPTRQLTMGDRIWAGSDYVYTHEVSIRDMGNGYFRKMHVWPNADDYDDFARQLPLPNMNELGFPSPEEVTQLGHGAMILPMFVFEDRGGYRALEKLQTSWQEAYLRGIAADELTDWSSTSDGGNYEEYIDEYESEGIDDSELVEHGFHDNWDLDNLSGDQILEDDASSVGDFDFSEGNTSSDAEDGHGDGHDASNENAAAFSSPEPEPSSVLGTVSARKRRIVADSDDELPSEVPRRKHARSGGSSSGTRSDTDDEGVNEASATRKRRRRAAVVDSDDESDDGGDDDEERGKGEQNGETRKKTKHVGPEEDDEENSDGDDDDGTSDNDDDDEEEEDSDEEEQNEVADVRRLSLAARLELVPPRHRSSRNRRIESTDDEEDDEEDEDDDNDDDDEDDERSEDELIDGIAEESDESD
ncbi:hypothetical protein M419DRAFT_36498 [Trichoderma reesei RUT C-30]|jgi:hypothetical protein|uniref:2EXR domain-containing protein n=1 Tax=Hypocrea jecorina (strain ATCC 56765 / BCRC 32924 / NRRL 11460 / Rut C-30) TaxID=1344414 RepID=A0A024SA11_HYPJR|nr:hypothetical protein M419DRAFT_36498 [Trichoderma reesei RUT C-30]